MGESRRSLSWAWLPWGLRAPLGAILLWWLLPIPWWALCLLVAATALIAHRTGRLSGWLSRFYRHEVKHLRGVWIRITWNMKTTNAGLGLKIPMRITHVRPTPVGVDVEFKPRSGESQNNLDYARHSLKVAWGAHDLSLERKPGSRHRWVYHLAYSDGFDREFKWNPHRPVTWNASNIPFGVDQYGREISMPVHNRSWLLGGLPGAGKSGGLNALLCGLAPLSDVAFFLVDRKLTELRPWAARASSIACDLGEIDELLKELVLMMRQRHQMMADSGLRLLKPAPEHPMIVTVIDELAVLFLGRRTDYREEKLRELVMLGRAAAMPVVMAAQRPTYEAVPTGIRDLCQVRVCYATANPLMSQVILGDTSSAAHEIPGNQPGVCYVLPDHQRHPTFMRTYHVHDDHVVEIVEQTRSLVPVRL